MQLEPADTFADLLASEQRAGRITAAAALVEARGHAPVRAATKGVNADRSLFDAASLTKPFVATLALRLAQSGRLPWGLSIGELRPHCAAGLARRPLRDLLRHRSGLEAWAPLYRRCRSPQAVEELLVGGDLVRAGRRSPLYSDLGYILWGLLAEEALGEPLRHLLKREVFDALGLGRPRVCPGEGPNVLPSLCDNRREVALASEQGVRIARAGPPPRGVPQDGNARFLGGLAGHAGLFVTGAAVLGLARAWLQGLQEEGSGVLEMPWVQQALAGRGPWATGWARRRVRGSAGPFLSADAFGHIGFTGGSVWVDPARSQVCVLMAHRRTPDVELTPLRHRFHQLASSLAS
jgi:CubicO group peptidase (beta-lactamase class C family)